MIQGVGSVRYPGQPLAKGSTGVLQDQLAQVENQLAACLHCETADTAAGKAKIQVISVRVQALKARVEELQKGKRGED
jgi:cell division protein FtsB